jgi:hypothetical protein
MTAVNRYTHGDDATMTGSLRQGRQEQNDNDLTTTTTDQVVARNNVLCI